MKVAILTAQAKKSEKTIELNDDVWAVPMNEDLVAQALYIYQANTRKGTAHAKTRGEVRGGGIKPWKQKGTGRARQGSIRSPLWTKGGVAFPPRSYKKVLKMSPRMKRKALCCVLSDHMKDEQVRIVDSFESVKDGKTKELQGLVNLMDGGTGAVLLIARKEDNWKKLILSARNIRSFLLRAPEEITVLDALWARTIVTVPDAVKVLEERLIKKKK